MRRHRPPYIALAGLALAASLGLHAAEPPDEEDAEPAEPQKKRKEELHLCLDRSGQLVYQTEPCPPQAAPPPPAPPPPVEAPKAPPPKPAAKPAPPKLQAAPPPTPAIPIPPPPGAKLRKREIHYAKPTAPAKRLRVEPLPNVDPRYATPERTWSTFSTALRAGDGHAARSCLTDGAREGLAPSGDSILGGGPWAVFVDDAARVEPEGHTGPFWSMRIERRGVRPKWVFLVRGEQGEWKIAAL